MTFRRFDTENQIIEIELQVPGRVRLSPFIVAYIPSSAAGPVVVFAEHPDRERQGISITNGIELAFRKAVTDVPFLRDIDPASTRFAETYLLYPTYANVGLDDRSWLDEVRFSCGLSEVLRSEFVHKRWRPFPQTQAWQLIGEFAALAKAAGVITAQRSDQIDVWLSRKIKRPTHGDGSRCEPRRSNSREEN